jgi:hypothetical protein
MISLNSLLWKIIYDDPLTMVYRPCYPWYFNPSPTHGVSTPYPLYLDLPTHGISTPHPWYFDSLPMVYRAPYPWYIYIDPPIHGILTPYPWYIDPPIHGIFTPLPMVYRTHGILTPCLSLD